MQKTTVLLTNVKTYEGNNVVRDYQITYELGTSTRRSRITQIKLCDAAANCLAPTTFGWQGTRDTITWSGVATDSTFGGGVPGDVNGDGLIDFAVGAGIYRALQGGGFELDTTTLCDPNVIIEDVFVTLLADINGDGYSDIPYEAYHGQSKTRGP